MAVLDPDLLLRAYSIGIFPMADSREASEVFWVEPRQRAILPLNRFHLSRSLRKTLRADVFTVTRDTAFAAVVRSCAERPETWINTPIERSYNRLHEAGHAHSIECWQEDELVGGLYGVRLAGAFFGESMFSVRTDASKVALAWLVARLRVGGFSLLDCQFMTEHLRSLGAIEIDQRDYVSLLSAALMTGSAAGSEGGTCSDGAAAGAVSALLGSPPEFEALDRLLEAAGADSRPPGWVIAQLLGQTS